MKTNGNNTIKLVVIGAILLFGLIACPATAYWTNTYQETDQEYGQAVTITPDGGFLIAGESWRWWVPNESDAWLVKAGPSGAFEWQAHFGGAYMDQAADVQVASDGGYILTGSDYTGVNGTQLLLVKTDNSGTLQWGKDFGGPGTEWGNAVLCTNDGGYLAVGTKHFPTNGEGLDQVYLVKTDAAGNLLWEREYGKETSSERGFSALKAGDGGYLIGATTAPSLATTPNPLGPTSLWLLKVNGNGVKKWAKKVRTPAGYRYDEPVSLAPVRGGAVFSVTSTKSGDFNFTQAGLVNVGLDGRIRWQRNYGHNGVETASRVMKTSDGGYVLAGTTKGSWFSYSQAYLVKTTPMGKLVWERNFGVMENVTGAAVRQTSDGGYVLAGSTDHRGPMIWDRQAFLVRTNAEGQ